PQREERVALRGGGVPGELRGAAGNAVELAEGLRAHGAHAEGAEVPGDGDLVRPAAAGIADEQIAAAVGEPGDVGVLCRPLEAGAEARRGHGGRTVAEPGGGPNPCPLAAVAHPRDPGYKEPDP